MPCRRLPGPHAMPRRRWEPRDKSATGATMILRISTEALIVRWRNLGFHLTPPAHHLEESLPLYMRRSSGVASANSAHRRCCGETSPGLEKMVITRIAQFSASRNCGYAEAPHVASRTRKPDMNFKGISAPLNAGRLEQLLGLGPSRHVETTQSDGRTAGADSADKLAAESLSPPPAYTRAATTTEETNRRAPLIVS